MIKIAVVGAGNMGRHHINTLLQLDGVQLVGVVDPSPRSLVPESIPVWPSLSALFSQIIPDAVCITAPTSLHHELGVQALEQGLDVFIEKPIASTLEQATHLIQLASQRQRILQVGHIERFNQAVLTLLQTYHANEWGEALLIQTHRMSPRPPQITDASVMIDLAVHDIEVVRAIMQTDPISRHTMTQASQDGHVDSGIISLQFPHALCTITVSWNSPIRARRLQMITTQGLVELDYQTQQLQFTPHVGTPHLLSKDIIPPLTAQLTHFMECIRDRKTPYVDGVAGLQALQWAMGQ